MNIIKNALKVLNKYFKNYYGILIIFLIVIILYTMYAKTTNPKKFVATFQHRIKGAVYFTQKSRNDPVIIKGKLQSVLRGEKAFHIHEFGDLTDGCKSCGSHYDIDHKHTHGSLQGKQSHTGDLGNVLFNENGECDINIKTNKLTLYGKHSILGRSLIIHAKKDDLGLGGTEESLKTGTAGSRVDCCVIGLTTF